MLVGSEIGGDNEVSGLIRALGQADSIGIKGLDMWEGLSPDSLPYRFSEL